MGNANGIVLVAGVAGNTIRGNTIVGNPAIQVDVDHTSNGGLDIKNMSAADANIFDSNVCLTGLNAPCPVIVPDAVSVLETELQSLGCGTYPPTASCQLSISQWNWYLVNKINPQATPLVIGDSTQEMTAQQYVQARAVAGL
jgi:hypothetical protein